MNSKFGKVQNAKEVMKTKKIDFQWMFVLFGTAIGAGILFLPLQADKSGIWAVLIATALIFPMMFFANKGLAYLTVANNKTEDLTSTLTSELGRGIGMVSTVIFFLSCYTVLLAYATSLPNSLSKLFNIYGITQLHLNHTIWFSFIILIGLIGIMQIGESFMLTIMSYMVYPLVVCLIIVSIVLIPHWSLSIFETSPLSFVAILKGLFMMIPILVFAMNFSQSMPETALYYKKEIPDTELCKKKITKNLKLGILMVMFFTMFLVYSTMFSVTQVEVHQAVVQNISILSLVATLFHNNFLKYFGPIIAVLGIVTSFLGVYLGTRESTNGIVKQIITWKNPDKKVNHKKINKYTNLGIFVTLWLVAIFNFRVLNLLGYLTAPAIALMIFFLPIFVIYKVEKFKKYKNKWVTTFMLAAGTLVILGYVIGIFL